MANEKPTGSLENADETLASPVQPSVQPAGAGHRLGGARADFVASLGRKVADLRAALASVEAQPEATSARDDLRRKLHALGAGARMLHFEAMARSILDTEAVLERSSSEGVVRPPDVERVARALGELPALAWGEERPHPVAASAEVRPESDESGDEPRGDAKGSLAGDRAGDHASEPRNEPRSYRPSAKREDRSDDRADDPNRDRDETKDGPFQAAAISVLVVGGEELADWLMEDAGDRAVPIECERVEELSKARSTALAFAPDVIVLDGDVEDAANFAEELLDDPMTDGAPVVVVLTPGRGDHATRFTALGVSKILARPLLPGSVRAACQEAVDQRDGKTVKMTLGEPTVAQLGERLAAEVRRALVDSLDPHEQATKVALGDGTEVWGALWGAIARVREVVTASTQGVVQYTGDGPEGALALAPVLTRAGGAATSDRAATVGRNRDEAVDVSLSGRRVIVADDDPGVTWFISDLLRRAGCVVHEALDGQTALRMAYELSPELVVSDILMPGLDGFALCRALRRDVALRDTPVILLSWKEDLLQRVRELGASAAAYLRKESDARAIVARVREVMRPRARIAARLKGHGEVRGRLDGITVRTLFELVIGARPAARVSLRDASFLYEVELRDGGIHSASRTSGDGSFLRGDRVIPAMLGVGAGRFVVSSLKSVPGEKAPATLAAQFARPIALARAALQATTGARMMTVAKVVLDDDDVTGYLLATPEPARDLVRRLARGTSPREILLHGDASPGLMEDVLADLATRGAIVAVYGSDGSDAVREEAFDPEAILPDGAGGARPLAPPLMPVLELVPDLQAHHERAPDARAIDRDAPLGPSLESAVMEAMSGQGDASLTPAPFRAEVSPVGRDATEPMALLRSAASVSELADAGTAVGAARTPNVAAPAAAASAEVRDLSIPLVVEPTIDLRLRPGEVGPSPVSLRARPPKPALDQEPEGFPTALALGLALLVVVVAALAMRWNASRDTAPAVVNLTNPSGSVALASPAVRYDDLPPSATVPTGQGLLIVYAVDGVPVRVDGSERTAARDATTLRVPLLPGVHLVSVGTGDAARSRIVEVRAGLATSVKLDEP